LLKSAPLGTVFPCHYLESSLRYSCSTLPLCVILVTRMCWHRPPQPSYPEDAWFFPLRVFYPLLSVESPLLFLRLGGLVSPSYSPLAVYEKVDSRPPVFCLKEGSIDNRWPPSHYFPPLHNNGFQDVFLFPRDRGSREPASFFPVNTVVTPLQRR